MKVWSSWAVSRNINCSMETMAPTTLDKVLQKFYLEVRKQDGSEYEPDSLKVMQAALERYLFGRKCPYSLINSRGFSTSRAVLDAKAKQLRMNGYGKRKSRAQPYNSAEEESFWSSGLLGDHNGVALTNANYKNLSEHQFIRVNQTSQQFTNCTLNIQNYFGPQSTNQASSSQVECQIGSETFVTPNCWMASLDLKDAYYSARIH